MYKTRSSSIVQIKEREGQKEEKKEFFKYSKIFNSGGIFSTMFAFGKV
jgi:hypothetical protein